MVPKYNPNFHPNKVHSINYSIKRKEELTAVADDHAIPLIELSKLSKIIEASAGQPTPWIAPFKNQTIDKNSTEVPKVKAMHNSEVDIKPNINNTLQLNLSQTILQKNLLKPYDKAKFDEMIPMSLFESWRSMISNGRETVSVLLTLE